MMTDDVKGRILQAAIALLDEVEDPAEITVREIVERAGVGLGSINYHFGSKEGLLNDAIGQLMQNEAARWVDPALMSEADPAARLKGMLRQMSYVGLRYPHLLRHLTTTVLLEGDMEPELTILPVLRELFKGSHDELALRLAASQIVIPLQALAVRSAQFHLYLGIDPLDRANLATVIDRLVDNLIKGLQE